MVIAAFAQFLKKQQKYDVLTTTNITIGKGGNRSVRHGRSEEQKEYYQERECSKKAIKKGFERL